MAKGVKTGGGSRKGRRNKKTQELLDVAQAGGEMPLDHMLAFMRDETNSKRDRLLAAINAAPYVHSKLASITHKGDPNAPIQLILQGSDIHG